MGLEYLSHEDIGRDLLVLSPGFSASHIGQNDGKNNFGSRNSQVSKHCLDGGMAGMMFGGPYPRAAPIRPVKLQSSSRPRMPQLAASAYIEDCNPRYAISVQNAAAAHTPLRRALLLKRARNLYMEDL